MNEFELLKRYIVANRFIPVPPAERNQSGSPDPEAFRKVGVSMLERLVAVGLTPQHHLLALGSGMGRLAIPLTQYLDVEAAILDLAKFCCLRLERGARYAGWHNGPR